MQSSRDVKVEIQSSDVVASAWSTFHRVRCKVQLDNGACFIQEREFINRGNAVAVLVYDPQRNTVLLTRQFRLPVFDNDPEDSLLIECCGGMRSQDERPESVVIVEVEEELGVHLTTAEWVFAAYSSPGSITEKIDYYLAPYSAERRLSQGGGLHAHGEVIEILEYTLDEVFAMIHQNEIKDLRTIALIYYLKLRVDRS